MYYRVATLPTKRKRQPYKRQLEVEQRIYDHRGPHTHSQCNQATEL
jgi:hypothetical protein